jgi:hypothetical protein
VSLPILTASTAVAAMRAVVSLAGAGATYAMVTTVRHTRVRRVPRVGDDAIDDGGAAAPPLALHAAEPGSRSATVQHVPRRAPQPPAETRWGLADCGDLDASACDAFLNALDELTRDAWLAIGRRARARDADMAAAIHALDAAVGSCRADVTAWIVRDAAATALQAALVRHAPLAGRPCAPPPPSADEARDAGAACVVAGHAAVAQLVRPWLSPAHHRTLTAPFARDA